MQIYLLFFLADTQVSLQLHFTFQQLHFLLKSQNIFSKCCLNVSEQNQGVHTQVQGEKEEAATSLYLHTFTTVVELQTSHSPVNIHLKIMISQLSLSKKSIIKFFIQFSSENRVIFQSQQDFRLVKQNVLLKRA